MSDYIFGKNTVVSYLDSNLIEKIIIVDNFSDRKILDTFNNYKIQIEKKDKKYLDKITNNGNHQGVIAKIKEYKYQTLDKIIENGKNKERPFIVILDGIEDPHNFGAIIRTCEAFGVDGIIIPKYNACPVNATVAKVSTGAIANIDVCEVTNLNQTIEILKEKGYWIYAAEAFNSIDYQDEKYNCKVALILGSEGKGISRLVKENSDINIKIPMKGKVNSLNVSVAAAILISHISLKQ